MAGGTISNIWKPPVGVTPGAAGDATAPFALGSRADIVPPSGTQRSKAQFMRATGVIAIGGTTGVTNGVQVAAGAGNTWTNDTGQATVLGDYLWVTTAEVYTP
jgi:hypothetical protein